MDIKIGDVVTLKSGGLYMTVSCLNFDDSLEEPPTSVDVVYFDNDGNFRTDEMIPVDCLRIKKEEA